VLWAWWAGLRDRILSTPAPPAGLKAFFTTPQLEPIDKVANSLALGTSPIVRSLFDPEGGMRVRRTPSTQRGEGGGAGGRTSTTPGEGGRG